EMVLQVLERAVAPLSRVDERLLVVVVEHLHERVGLGLLRRRRRWLGLVHLPHGRGEGERRDRRLVLAPRSASSRQQNDGDDDGDENGRERGEATAPIVGAEGGTSWHERT